MRLDQPVHIFIFGGATPQKAGHGGLIREGSLIKSPLSLETAIFLLNTEVFDLILFEPKNQAILHPQPGLDQVESVLERGLN
ncbi:MAG: hypothetical protein C0407_10040 [Desulfobacca sp.]|nr:hypothetical protein [Desulfobacca sp.]